MKGKWMEVWARERGAAETALLFKFPLEQWRPGSEAETRQEMEQAGCTEIQFKEVDEGCGY